MHFFTWQLAGAPRQLKAAKWFVPFNDSNFNRSLEYWWHGRIIKKDKLEATERSVTARTSFD